MSSMCQELHFIPDITANQIVTIWHFRTGFDPVCFTICISAIIFIRYLGMIMLIKFLVKLFHFF